MCAKKILGGGSSSAAKQETPAVAVAAPSANTESSVEKSNGATNTQAKGKRKLTINQIGMGTGVNI